jgi:hypothetical protein
VRPVRHFQLHRPFLSNAVDPIAFIAELRKGRVDENESVELLEWAPDLATILGRELLCSYAVRSIRPTRASRPSDASVDPNRSAHAERPTLRLVRPTRVCGTTQLSSGWFGLVG